MAGLLPAMEFQEKGNSMNNLLRRLGITTAALGALLLGLSGDANAQRNRGRDRVDNQQVNQEQKETKAQQRQERQANREQQRQANQQQQDQVRQQRQQQIE